MKYKQYLKTILNNKSVPEKAKLLQAKINTNSITSTDFSQINELDELLTSGMLKAERMITRYGLQYPWSPALAIAIIQLSIWKLIKSELKTKTSRVTKVQQITTRLHNLDNQYPSSIIPYKYNTMNTINKHIRNLTNTLNATKQKLTLTTGCISKRNNNRGEDDNHRHDTYLSNLLLIEHQ